MTDIVQGSEAWHALRCGKATASRIADVVAKTKTGISAMRATYMGELIAERLTGVVVEGFKSAAMQYGSETEAEARTAYEWLYDCEVDQVAFVEHPTIAMSGASPDGLVGPDGMVEFKAPNTWTHIESLLGGSVPGRYITQVQWQMACRPERKWVDWCSYDNRLPENMRLFVKRIARDDKHIAELESEVLAFLCEVENKVAKLTARYGQREAA
jgi:putative phage-type endonuclease